MEAGNRLWSVVITDHGFTDIENEKRVISDLGAELRVFQCRTEEEVAAAAGAADAVLVQWAPVTKSVLDQLSECKVIVRYGIGTDNVDLAYARKLGIPVCNVPEYCIEEVANHTIALAMGLQRQLVEIDRRVRNNVWKIVPDHLMPAASDLEFCTLGFGRIAREVLKRASVLGFRCLAVDPFQEERVCEQEGVDRVSLDEAFERADVLSLHLPLNSDTKHVVGKESISRMKKHAIILNTARGGLVDTFALSEALGNGQLGGAGIDVFETEPLETDHPLRTAPRTILSSHVAWYSEAAVPRLQQQAAEEIARALNGQPLRHCVN